MMTWQRFNLSKLFSTDFPKVPRGEVGCKPLTVSDMANPHVIVVKGVNWAIGLLRSPGRPLSFDKATEQKLREMVREEAVKQKKYYGKLPGAQSKTMVGIMRKFADAEGVKATDRTLRRRVVDPVLRELKNKA
jgi:hypothetical protein